MPCEEQYPRGGSLRPKAPNIPESLIQARLPDRNAARDPSHRVRLSQIAVVHTTSTITGSTVSHNEKEPVTQAIRLITSSPPPCFLRLVPS